MRFYKDAPTFSSSRMAHWSKMKSGNGPLNARFGCFTVVEFLIFDLYTSDLAKPCQTNKESQGETL